MMDQFQAKFIEEANDLIATLEKTLLALEQNTEDKSLVEKTFRVMHTLKGNSSMFGFEKMGAVTHHLETIYDFIREGKRSVTKELLTITFQSLDHFKVLLTDPHLTDPVAAHVHEQIMQQIHNLINGKQTTEVKQVNQKGEELTKGNTGAEVNTYYVLFLPHAGILANGTNPLYLMDELCSLGTSVVVPHLQQIPDVSTFDLSKCYTYWEVYLAAPTDANAIKDVFIFVEDECEIKIEKLAGRNLLKDQDFFNKISAQQRTQANTNLGDLQQLIENIEATQKKK